MARAKPLGDGRVVLVLTDLEATALWQVLYRHFRDDQPDLLDMPLRRVQEVLGEARSSDESHQLR